MENKIEVIVAVNNERAKGRVWFIDNIKQTTHYTSFEGYKKTIGFFNFNYYSKKYKNFIKLFLYEE